MLFHVVLNFASLYFFVPLLLGWMVVATAGAGWGPQRVIGWLVVALGAWGAVSGVPYWRAQVAQKFENKSYVDERCKLAGEQLARTFHDETGIATSVPTFTSPR